MAIRSLGAPDLTIVQQAVAGMLSNDPPKSEAKAASPGVANKVPRDDHQHPRLTSATSHITDASGECQIVFTRTFSAAPSIVLTARENNKNPVPALKVLRFLKAGSTQGTYVQWDPTDSGSDPDPVVGCVVYASRAMALSVMAPITGITLITALVPALNTLFSGLSGFLPDVAAGSLRFSCVALQTSAL